MFAAMWLELQRIIVGPDCEFPLLSTYTSQPTGMVFRKNRQINSISPTFYTYRLVKCAQATALIVFRRVNGRVTDGR